MLTLPQENVKQQRKFERYWKSKFTKREKLLKSIKEYSYQILIHRQGTLVEQNKTTKLTHF